VGSAEGDSDGIDDGFCDGFELRMLVGDEDAVTDGATEFSSLGEPEGFMEGPWLGEAVGTTDGPSLGKALGDSVGGAETVGGADTKYVGSVEGDPDGIDDGLSD